MSSAQLDGIRRGACGAGDNRPPLGWVWEVEMDMIRLRGVLSSFGGGERRV